MAGSEVSRGFELNSYKGDAALAGGSSGVNKIDLSPLATYALNKFQTNLIDYETQQKDKQHLQEMFYDPKNFQALDKEYAMQLEPLQNEFLAQAKGNLQMEPNSDKWYSVHESYADLTKKNAQLKTVQAEKDKYEKLAGASRDEHEREAMTEYVNKLKTYKLGDDIPAYKSYIPFNESHLPETATIKGTKQKINGQNVETVEYTVNNARALDKKAKLQRLANPKAFATGEDLGHTLVQHGGVPELNKAAKLAYDNSLRYNVQDLQTKYATEIAAYKKANPTATNKEAVTAIGQGTELQAIYDDHNFLIGGQNGNGAVQYVPVINGEPPLDNYTYTPDGKQRLNVDNDTLRAIYKATEIPMGASERVIKSEVSKLPSEIAQNEAQIGTAKATTALRQEQAKTQKSVQAKNYAAADHYKTQTKALNPLPSTIVPQIGREATVREIKVRDSSGKVTSTEKQILIDSKTIPESVRRTSGFIPTKPVLTGDKTKDAVLLDKYNKKVSEAESGTVQMRFFKPSGEDITINTINKSEATKEPMNKVMESAVKNGLVVKFIDKNGNIIGTTESINDQRIIENAKATNKGDGSLGTELPDEVVEEF